MKKLFLGTALMLISLQGKLYAQTLDEPTYPKRTSLTKAQQTFEPNKYLLNIRDFVVLKEGRLILELATLDDYENFRNLDSLLLKFKQDIAFYKDSLDANPTYGMRIDYVVNSEYSFKKIRFKKYPSDGNIFLNQDGSISKLKFEQDTVRLIIQKSRQGLGRHKQETCSIPYSIQATFVLGNYYDIDKLIEDKILNGIIDTLEKTSQNRSKGKYEHNFRYTIDNPFSISYNPYYSGKSSLVVYTGLIEDESDIYSNYHKKKFYSVNANIGLGIIRNTFTPMTDIGVQYNKYWRNQYLHNIIRVSATPYYFFDKDAQDNLIVNDNWFLNISIGDISTHLTTSTTNWTGYENTLGFGYLVAEKGGYFKNTTFKIFTDILYRNKITIVPEFIFTNNCKQIFPGITVKIF